MKKKSKLFLLAFFSLFSAAFAKDLKKADLTISDSDILFVNESEGSLVKDGKGIHLFVRKRGDIESIMLIHYKPERGSPKRILRATESNPINGDERFQVRGISSHTNRTNTDFLLIATKTENNDFLGECFHIYIPQKVIYGIDLTAVPQDFSFQDLKIRTFERKYCDALGSHFDYDIGSSADVHSKAAFSEISSKSGGTFQFIENPESLTQKLAEEIDSLDQSGKIELVFAIDATESMKDDFDELKKNWLLKFENQMKKFKNAKIGLLFYKDYGDEFREGGLPVKNFGFLKDARSFSRAFGKVSARGGGDREESVLEALYACSVGFSWSGDAKKKIILIGDAPPHQDNGKFDLNEILKSLSDKNIAVDCFLIAPPNEKSPQMKTVEKRDAPGELQKSVEALDAK